MVSQKQYKKHIYFVRPGYNIQIMDALRSLQEGSLRVFFAHFAPLRETYSAYFVQDLSYQGLIKQDSHNTPQHLVIMKNYEIML